MTVLVDTNVVLDVMLAREPFVMDSAQVLAAAETSSITGLLCATTVTTIHYIARRELGTECSLARISELMTLFRVAPVNGVILESAMRLKMRDFEDAVLHESAVQAGADCIVTRNTSDFKTASLLVLEPSQLITHLETY